MLDPRLPRVRWTMAAMLMVLLGVGACATPTTTEVEMGKQMSFELAPDGEAYELMSERTDGMSQISELLAAVPGVEEVSVRISETHSGPVVVDFLVWGANIDQTRLLGLVREAYPSLAGVPVVITDLHGRVRESLASKIGRNVFHLELNIVEESTEQQIRDDILRQLDEQDFDGDARVHVSRDGNVTSMGVTLTSEDGENVTEEVIELITEGDATIQIETGDELDEGDEGLRRVRETEGKKQR